MSSEMSVRAICAILVAVPGTLALVPGLVLAPWQSAVFLVLALAGATVLSQLPPAGTPSAPPGTEVDDLIDRLEALPHEDRAELSARLEWRAKLRDLGVR